MSDYIAAALDAALGPDPGCPTCGRERCSGECRRPRRVEAGPGLERRPPAVHGLDRARIVGAADLADEGRRLLAEGVRYTWGEQGRGVLPDYGMAGAVAAFSKVGKTTLALPLVSAISRGAEFLGLPTSRKRVLYVGLEDPREYLAWHAARALRGDENILFYVGPLTLNDATLSELEALVRGEGIGFVYVSTLMAGLRSVVREENGNAEMAGAIETIKLSARRTGVLWLLEAHAGKGEDSSADADPVRALRGASAAGAAFDFVLSLRRDGRGQTTQRVLGGAGRFVGFDPIRYDWLPQTGELVLLSGEGSRNTATAERLIRELGGVVEGDLRSVSAVIRACGATDKGSTRAEFRAALEAMPEVEKVVSPGRGGKVARYRLVSEAQR